MFWILLVNNCEVELPEHSLCSHLLPTGSILTHPPSFNPIWPPV
uniref:Uncharacterized protein n=1 Tax=Anguilla anguilla TaxID=7936 RepID=A0A0E9UTJ2_ANGAN